MLRSLQGILPFAQIVTAILLIVAVLFQPSTAGMGSFGGSDATQNFHTKRGFEKFLFIITIVLGVVFAALCVFAIVIK